MLDLTKIKKLLPDFNLNQFNIFDTITYIEWKTVFDYELWYDKKILTLTLANKDGFRIQIEFINVDNFRFCGNGQIAGFYIKDMTAYGYESDSKYKIGDYENNDLEFYCTEIIITEFSQIN